MRRLKLSIARLTLILAVLAVDMAVLRSLGRFAPGTNQTLYLIPIDATHFMTFLTLALGVLPMASLLVPAAIFQALEVRRTGRVSAWWVGFVTFGWCSLFLFMSVASLSPPAVQRYLLWVGQWVGPAFLPLVGEEPIAIGTARDWIVQAIEGTIGIIAFSLPELAFALAGGWFIGRSRARVVNQHVAQETPPRQAFAHEPVAT